MFPQNVGKFLQDYMVLHLRRLPSSQTLLREPQILHNTCAYSLHYFQAQNVALVAEEELYF
jgi:hypothetical protein